MKQLKCLNCGTIMAYSAEYCLACGAEVRRTPEYIVDDTPSTGKYFSLEDIANQQETKICGVGVNDGIADFDTSSYLPPIGTPEDEIYGGMTLDGGSKFYPEDCEDAPPPLDFLDFGHTDKVDFSGGSFSSGTQDDAGSGTGLPPVSFSNPWES